MACFYYMPFSPPPPPKAHGALKCFLKSAVVLRLREQKLCDSLSAAALQTWTEIHRQTDRLSDCHVMDLIREIKDEWQPRVNFRSCHLCKKEFVTDWGLFVCLFVILFYWQLFFFFFLYELTVWVQLKVAWQLVDSEVNESEENHLTQIK